MRRVAIAGEGKCELGGFWDEFHPSSDETDDGVIAALLRTTGAQFAIERGWAWKSIPKYRAGAHRENERRAVLGLIQMAKERGFDCVAFCRDQDGDLDRQRAIDTAIAEAPMLFANCPAIIGGVAIQNVEAWILAYAGVAKSESLSKPRLDLELARLGIPAKSHVAYANHIKGNAADIPKDAASLRNWLALARATLSESSGS
jgi:hypothetical protein